MTEQKHPLGSLFAYGVALVFLALLTYVYIGLFSTNPRLQAGSRLLILQWIARFGIPILAAGLLYLCYGIGSARIPLSSVAVLGASLLFCALLAYPLLLYFNPDRARRESIERYHPYLQISPPDFRERRSNSTMPRFKIFCLGGSTTELADTKGRDWPSRVEERLKGTIPDRQIEVHNLARRWYTTQHTLINYAINLRQHRPNVVIVTHAINDLLHNADFCYYSGGKFREDYGHFYGPIYRLIQRPSDWEPLYRKIRMIWYYTPREVIDTEEFPGLVPFKRNLHTLIDLAKIDGTTVVLMTQPYLIKASLSAAEDAALRMVHVEAVGPNKEWSIYTARRGMEKYTAAVRNVAEEKGVQVIDLERVVPKSLEYFTDDVHYRDKTFDLIADHIADRLKQMRVLR